jgi:hypothetical protein
LVRELTQAGFLELGGIVEDSIELYERQGRPLPKPMSGRESANALQLST